MIHPPRLLTGAALAMLLLAGCASLRDAFEPPTATITGARVAALSFDFAQLVLDVRIDNPNAIGIELAGFDYRVRAEGRTVVQGEQRRRLELAANEATVVEVPLQVGFGNIAGVIGALAGRNAIDYDLELGIDVDVPVLGERRVRAQSSGTLPVPHRPRLSLESLRLQQLDFTGAELRAVLRISNPNGFALVLDQLDYRLEVDGRRWARGGSSAPLRVPAKGSGTLNLSLQVDFTETGSAAYSLLARGHPIDYALYTLLRATATDSPLGEFEMPWSRSGRLELR